MSDTPNKQIDYIALGSPECDDQVCLRTGKPDLTASALPCSTAADCAGSMDCSADGLCVYNDACVDTTTTTCADTAKKAMGYCTKECINDSDCGVDYRGGNKMICRQLNFSPEFLAALKADCASDPPARDDPCTYNQMFGAGAASNYCIAPRSAAAP